MKKSSIKRVLANFIAIFLSFYIVGCTDKKEERIIASTEEYFEMMTSNCIAGSSNQTFFYTVDKNQEYTGRVFYKVFQGGKKDYSFLFSSTTDSSYPNINYTQCNTDILDWEIIDAKVGVAKSCDMMAMPEVSNFKQLTFYGRIEKKVNEPDLFYTDKVELDVATNDYLCLEVTYKGACIPHHYENTIPAFKLLGDRWIPSNEAVFAQMVGCDRVVEKKIAVIGDSITQGLGVEKNSYQNWAALLGESLGKQNAFWNLGIGYSTASDCATDKLWLKKAKQNDLVVVCFGVNDIGLFNDEEKTKADLLKIVTLLNEAGCKVIVQTLPPFNFTGEKLTEWNRLNAYIKEELSQYVAAVFDVSPLLVDGLVENGVAKYGGHPNAEGCAIWANALYEFIQRNAFLAI